MPFVGRGDEIDKLLQGIRPRRMHYWISGPAGVGKSYLIKHLRQRVTDETTRREYRLSNINCLFAQTDHEQRDAPKAMNKLLSDLKRGLRKQSCSFKEWKKSYREWHQSFQHYEGLLRQAESDLDAPPDLHRTLVMLSVKAMGVVGTLTSVAAAARSGHPVTVGLADTARSEIVPALEERVKDFLKSRFEKHDRELLCSPIHELTPKFKEALSQLDSGSVRVILVLDEYELTRTILEPWLGLLWENGSFLQQSKVVVMILSQQSLPRDGKSLYEDEFTEIPLRPFAYPEDHPDEIWAYVRAVLGNRADPGIHNSERIHQQSEGLPFLVKAIVDAYEEGNQAQADAGEINQVIRTALRRLDQRILRKLKDDSVKQLARFCAIPQRLTRDVFGDIKRFMLERRGLDVMGIRFDLLESQPFVDEDYCYNPTVRTVLVRNLYNLSYRDYEGLNNYLEEICARENEERDLSGRQWCEAEARRWYYALAASPRRSLAKALAKFVESLDRYYHPDDPPGTIVVLDIGSILEDLRKIRQDEEAFRLWSDYVSSFREDIEDVKKRDKWDECYLELYRQLIQFHFHQRLGGDDPRRRAYQDYDGFANEQVIDYLKRAGERSHRLGDYERAYQWFRKALDSGDQDDQTRDDLVLSLVCLAEENPHEAHEFFQEDEELLSQVLPELTGDLSSRFEGIRESLLNAR